MIAANKIFITNKKPPIFYFINEYILKMKTHMITLDESEEIITKFFTFNLDVERVVTAYR